jgi:3-hydroxyisobutyrate dehydrogenase
MKIGFIGLGHMGHPMVGNLLKKGFEVSVYDINRKAMESLKQEGAELCGDFASLTEKADVLITMVQTSEQVLSICLQHDGLFSHIKRDTMYIDCSSIDMPTTMVLHHEADKLNFPMLDAPVSGGVAGAKAGTLTFMVGGREEDFKRMHDVFAAMGKKIIYAGAAGHGQAAKICNNLILGISMIAVSEAFTLAEKLGLDLKKFFAISSNASGQCWSMTSYCPVPGILENVPANHQYQPGFMAKMMLKDLRLAHHAAEMTNSAIPLGAAATEIYELFVNQGFGETDFSGIINFIGNKSFPTTIETKKKSK